MSTTPMPVIASNAKQSSLRRAKLEFLVRAHYGLLRCTRNDGTKPS